MSNILKELKAEITRLARKEIKGELAQVKKVNATQRGLIAGLRKQVDALQGEVSSLKRAMPKADRVLEGKTEPKGRFWMTGQGVKAMRKRLGLTQKAFGSLVGVSSQAVVLWEGKSGKINLRKATAGRLQELKGKGKREVAEILAKAPKAKAKAKKKAR